MQKIQTQLEPIDFEQSNMLLKGNGTDVKDMRVFRDNQYCISCWKLSWKQAMYLLFKRKIYLNVLTFSPVPPVSVHIDAPFEKPESLETTLTKKGKENANTK